MPQQKHQTGESKPVSFRPGAIQRNRIDQLIELRQQNQSTILNAAIDLLWLFDIGFDRLDLMRQADLLTNYGQNDPLEDGNV